MSGTNIECALSGTDTGCAAARLREETDRREQELTREREEVTRDQEEVTRERELLAGSPFPIVLHIVYALPCTDIDQTATRREGRAR